MKGNQLGRPVTVTLIAREEGQMPIVLDSYTYTGRLVEKNGKIFVLYQETIGGENGKLVNSTIRIEEHKVAVLRDERLGGHMVFDPSHSQRVRFQTDFGEMEFFLFTTSLQQETEGNRISIHLQYTLQILFDEDELPDPHKQDVVRSMEIRIEPV